MRWLALLLLLTACSDNTTFTPVPSSTQFTSFYGKGLTYCDDFDFGEPHYCIKSMSARIGQTVTMTFTVSGDLLPTEGPPPARLRLMVWRRGDNMSCAGAYQGYRVWSTDVVLTPGTHTLSVQLDQANFTDCYGQHTGLAGALQDTYGIGYSFGGNFAGHGVIARGPAHFHLDSFTVQ